VAPAVIPLLAVAHNELFFSLELLNTAFYVGLYLRKRHGWVELILLQASTAMLVAGLPEHWGQWLMPEFLRIKAFAYGVGGHILIYSLCSRGPWLGLCGAVVAGCLPGVLLHRTDVALACQAGLMFLLAHSLRWTENVPGGAVVLRALAALAWVTHSF